MGTAEVLLLALTKFGLNVAFHILFPGTDNGRVNRVGEVRIGAARFHGYT